MYEGSTLSYIEVQSSAPPRLYCKIGNRDSGCRLVIRTELKREKREQKCPTGFEISQAVFAMEASQTRHDPCSYQIDGNAWTSVLRIPVKGSIDDLKDRDKKRNILITGHVIITDLSVQTVVVGQVQVGVVFLM